jgi:serine/threonine protein kinase
MIVPTVIHQYEIQNIIGKGGYSTVCKCLNIENGQTYAMKISSKLNVDSPKLKELFQREIISGTFLKHKNIVSLHDLFWDSDNFYLVEDYCSGGDLFNFIQTHELSQSQISKIFKQIIKAVQYCHKHSVAHRDLKLENIFLTEGLKVKIGDFGLCAYVSKDKLSKTFCGSFCYASPEIICQKQYDPRLSDIWSLGVILYALAVNDFPWEASNIHKIISLIRSCSYDIPQSVSKPCADLISKMMKNNPNERISLDDILNHPFFKYGNKICYKKLVDSNDLIPIKKFSKLVERECKENEKENQNQNQNQNEKGIYSPFNIKNKDQSTPYDFFKEIYMKEESSRKIFQKDFNRNNNQKYFTNIKLVLKSNGLQHRRFKTKSPSY